MSSTRRFAIAGLPLAAFAALAFVGSPAAAAVGDHVARPAVMVTPCADGRDKCDYGTPAGTPATTAPGGTVGGHTRGHGGYGTVSPTPSPTKPATSQPTPTPSSSAASVPTPGPSVSVQGSVAPSPSISTGGGVSAGHELPVTGAPMGAILSLGGLLVAGGMASVWYTRRRRNA